MKETPLCFPYMYFFFVWQVLDARDPQGTRCHHLEKTLKEHHKHKHMILLLNKVSCVPLLEYLC